MRFVAYRAKQDVCEVVRPSYFVDGGTLSFKNDKLKFHVCGSA